MKIAVDFDGTIVEHRYPQIGEEKLFAFETLKQLQKQGHQLILWTFRHGKELDEAIEFCKKRGIEFYAVNKSYPEEEFDSETISRKVDADVFIDDRNVGGFPGWSEIWQMLNPDYADAYNNRGIVHFKKGKFNSAIKDFDKCAISFLKRGATCNAVFHFVQIFNLISKTENLKTLCTECGLIAIFLMDKFKEGIYTSNILSKFGYEDLESLLKDVYHYENLLRNTYSIVLLYRLYKAYIDENVKVSEFLSEEEISFLNEKLLKDMKESLEEIDEERTKIILAALFS